MKRVSVKPKMLVFSHICSPQYVTGAEKLLLFMVRELLPSFQCTLVVPNEGVIAANARKLGITVIVHHIPLVVPLYLALPLMQDEIAASERESAWRDLVKLIDGERPNIILANTCVHPLPAIVGKALGIPVIWSVMETLRDTTHSGMAASIIEQYSDYVIGISESTLSPLSTPGLSAKSTLILPSWDQEVLSPGSWSMQRVNRRRQLGIEDHHRFVGYISSSIFEAKGLEHFMQMAVNTAVQYPHAMYLIVGNPVDPGYFNRCLDIARERGLMERFRWIRFEEQVESVYPAMDLLVVPSLTIEGFGMTALEGMVFGKAVVAYGSGGLSEIGRATGNEVFTVPTGDSAMLTGAVSSLLADDVALQAVSARNAQAAHAVYGITAYRERLRMFVEQLSVRGYIPLTLVRSTGSPSVYLYEDGVLRQFRSMKLLLRMGYSMEEARVLPDAVIAAWPKGAPIGTALRRRRRRGRIGGSIGRRRRRKSGGSARRRLRGGRQRSRRRNAAGGAGRRKRSRR
ncbi:Glycosyltransferase involved in cell wall bisynthesis [Paenibacillus sp. OV219]|nr:Glycosyltransferase involved in cell wall bisynthesis [Paenibacillus sp. OV219]